MTDAKDYKFVPGGIIWKILDRAGFERRRLRFKILVVMLLVGACWVPLALLSFFQLGWNQFLLLFVRDVSTHVRFLFVFPILLFVRNLINKSFTKTIDTFYDTKIVNTDNRAEFEKEIAWLLKWRNFLLVDICLIVLVYYAFYVRETTISDMPDFYAPWVLQNDHISYAGWWYVIFSLPILQMVLYRWLYSIVTWTIFLWKVSNIDLALSSLHPDGMGGLGFLKYTQLSFFPVAFAFSSLLAGGMSNMIIFSNATIRDFIVLIAALLIVVLLLFILPLLVFLPLLSSVKRRYFLQYSIQAWDFARAYEKELKEYYETGENKPDASWHVDMIGSFEKTSSMQTIIIDKAMLVSFIVAVILPFIPVILQEIPLRNLLAAIVSRFLG